MQTLVAIFAIGSYCAFVWFLYGKQIRMWLVWIAKRMREYSDETRRLNRMWDLGDA